jgi:hypothetical protein
VKLDGGGEKAEEAEEAEEVRRRPAEKEEGNRLHSFLV